LKDLVERIQGIMSKIVFFFFKQKTAYEIVNDIKTAIRVINCATAVEGNVAGCIGSLLGGPLMDFLIKKIVENCRVQRTIIRHLLGLQTIKTDAPNWIAQKLINFARGLL